MRIARPSGKAVLVAGSLALTLVVGATTGAVAGGLITSKDIKDNTIRSRDIHKDGVKASDIAAGAVTWDKSLDQATRDLIEGLAQSGAAGPPGAPGPAGPAGSAGADAELVAWNSFEGDGTFEPLLQGPLAEDGPFSSIGYVKLDGDRSVDVGPGTYLVSMRAATDVNELADSLDLDINSLLTLFGIISPSVPLQVMSDTIEDGETVTANTVSAWVDTEALSRSCLSIVVCNTSYAVTVPAGQTLDLSNLWLLTFGDPCDEDGDCVTPVKVNVAVTRLAGTPADFIEAEPYTINFCQAVDPDADPDPCGPQEKQIRPRQLKGFVAGLVPSAS